jgi:hypothetical protein
MLNWVALDKVFKSLADPWRRHMTECLCDRQASVSWLAEHLPLSLATIPQQPVHASGMRSIFAAHTKSFSDSPRTA